MRSQCYDECAIIEKRDSLVVVHSISRVDAENVPARLRAGPIEIPIIVSGHLQPSTLLKVVKQNGFIHVRAKADFHSLIFIVSDSEKRFRR